MAFLSDGTIVKTTSQQIVQEIQKRDANARIVFIIGYNLYVTSDKGEIMTGRTWLSYRR